MSVKVFVDTNILVYARDQSEAAKQAMALQWLEILWQQRSGRLSFQTLNEFYVTVTQRLKPGLSRSEAQADIRNLSAAQIQDCTYILSEDMQHRQQVGGLTILNPFLADISLLTA